MLDPVSKERQIDSHGVCTFYNQQWKLAMEVPIYLLTHKFPLKYVSLYIAWSLMITFTKFLFQFISLQFGTQYNICTESS